MVHRGQIAYVNCHGGWSSGPQGLEGEVGAWHLHVMSPCDLWRTSSAWGLNTGGVNGSNGSCEASEIARQRDWSPRARCREMFLPMPSGHSSIPSRSETRPRPCQHHRLHRQQPRPRPPFCASTAQLLLLPCPAREKETCLLPGCLRRAGPLCVCGRSTPDTSNVIPLAGHVGFETKQRHETGASVRSTVSGDLRAYPCAVPAF